MRPDRLFKAGLLFIVALGPATAPGVAGDSVAEAKLKAKGLSREGRVFVDAQAEKPVLARMKEVRATSYAAFASAAEKQATAENAQMTAAQLQQDHQQYQAALNYLNQAVNAQNSSMGGGRYAKYARMMPSELKIEQQQVSMALKQTAANQNAIKGQIPSAKDKAAIDADVKKKGDVFKSDLVELRKMIDEVTQKYATYAADEPVKKSLDELTKAGHATIKLGPSEAFTTAVKEVDHAERQFLGKKPEPHAKKKSVAKSRK
jgi:hypothetical protein